MAAQAAIHASRSVSNRELKTPAAMRYATLRPKPVEAGVDGRLRGHDVFASAGHEKTGAS
jgi:hypothetical protein